MILKTTSINSNSYAKIVYTKKHKSDTYKNLCLNISINENDMQRVK